MLRTPPRLGRPFTAEEDRPGAAPVVVLGGVMPPGFAFPRRATALWRPMRLDPENVRLGFFGLNGVVRMADGASLEQVRAETEAPCCRTSQHDSRPA